MASYSKQPASTNKPGLVVIAIHENNGTFLYNPPADKKIGAGDALLVIANQRQLQTLHKLTGDSS